jgi:hypothetical protein
MVGLMTRNPGDDVALDDGPAVVRIESTKDSLGNFQSGVSLVKKVADPANPANVVVPLAKLLGKFTYGSIGELEYFVVGNMGQRSQEHVNGVNFQPMASSLQCSPPKPQKFTVGFSARFHQYTGGNESLALKFVLAKQDPTYLHRCIPPPRDSTSAGNPGDNHQESIRYREALQVKPPFQLRRSSARTAGGHHPHPQT